MASDDETNGSFGMETDEPEATERNDTRSLDDMTPCRNQDL